MEIIVFEKETYWKMQTELMQMFQKALKEANKEEDDWIPTEKAKALLGVKSKSKMQELRDNDCIKFSKLGKKTIMYSHKSILDFLKRNIPKY
ncbi:MAG: helix-turn-helix domain-containing protein [Bacteroidetes bacterium]|nr:helix-turn-helix domain-containing protein [Bacteroidota bacterium]